MRRSALFLLLITMDSCSIFNGCDKDNDLVVLREDTRQWTPYSRIREVLFENGSIESTLTVFEFNDTVEPYDRGDECAFGTEEVVLTKLVSVLFADTIKVKLSRQKRLDIENTNFHLIYLDDTKNVYPTDINKKYQNTLTIDQKVFNDVIISQCSNCNELSEIVFSKNNGLVAFKLNNAYWTKKQ